jgi:hypothetical protein
MVSWFKRRRRVYVLPEREIERWLREQGLSPYGW